MSDDPRPRIGTLLAERARASGAVVELRAVRKATLLTCDSAPRDLGVNRALEVDAREVGLVEELAHTFLRSGRRVLVELDAATLGDAERARLASLDLSKSWDLFTYGIELAAVAPLPASAVHVREVGASDAAAFGELAVRAYGRPPPGFPATDPRIEEKKWSAFVEHRRARCFIAELDGVPCAMAMSLLVGQTALVDGAATVTAFRGRGVQSTLLVHRFLAARAEGARYAVTRAANPASIRNLVRAGMHLSAAHEVWMDPAALRV